MRFLPRVVGLVCGYREKEHSSLPESDPVALICFLMNEHQIDRSQMMEILGVNKGTLSKILNYKCGLSKETIRKLAAHFKLSQEAFNRPYPLLLEINNGPKKSTLKKPKEIVVV